MIQALENLIMTIAFWYAVSVAARFVGACISYELDQWVRRNPARTDCVAAKIERALARWST